MLECMKPFDAVAALVVSFRSQGVPYEVRLALPCVFTKFFEPVQLSPNVFVQRWATLGAPGLEHMVTFAATAGSANAAFAKPRLADLVRVAVVDGGGVGVRAEIKISRRLRIIIDVDSLVDFCTGRRRRRLDPVGRDDASSPNGHGQRRRREDFVGCLIRLEMNEAAGAFRLTVRTAVPRVHGARGGRLRGV